MADFSQAFEYAMDHEDTHRSGKITHDAGGATRFGIAQRFHPDLPAEFYDEKTDLESVLLLAKSLFNSDYWTHMGLSALVDQSVANKLLDMGINMGVGEAAKLAQKAANGLLRGSASAPKIDGLWGPKTIAALNGCAPEDLIETLSNLAKIFYYEDVEKHPLQQPNLRGWLKRAECRPPEHLCDEHSAAKETSA